MVDVCGGDVDNLEKRGHEISIIPGDFEKLLIFGNLIHSTLASDHAIGRAK